MPAPARLVLSRLCLDLQSAEARRDLFNPYQMHRTLLRGFDTSRGAAGLLYRVEMGMTDAMVIAQSWHLPEWSRLPVGYVNAASAAGPVKSWQPQFVTGQQLRFRLRANPTFKRGRLRLGWLREAEQLAWLVRQGKRHGFALVHTWAGREGLVKMGRRGSVVTCHSVLFGGFVEVTDPRLLATAVATGLGSAKAFGFGLLSLAPADATGPPDA